MSAIFRGLTLLGAGQSGAGHFGTSPDFWLNGQLRWDLYHAMRAEARALRKVKPLRRGKAA